MKCICYRGLTVIHIWCFELLLNAVCQPICKNSQAASLGLVLDPVRRTTKSPKLAAAFEEAGDNPRGMYQPLADALHRIED